MNKVEVKPYSLAFEDRGEYLYANVKGDSDSCAISTQYWNEAHAECRRTGHAKLLVYEELETQVTVNESFYIACALPRDDFAGLKIAFVDRYEEHACINGYTHAISLKRGRNVEVFKSVAEAERWLLVGENGQSNYK